jgi:twitching motility protein PilT
VLLPNSGARGTIRAGQFGQVANVIQSGGEEGMWTFDRYQRWMEQQREWVRPATPPPATANDEIVRSTERVAAPPMAPPRRMAPTAARKPAAGAPPAGPEEISIDEDLDLEDIAELARKIERRTP